ncbi:hypothetical protein JDV02_001399 [Purpureocillium takamizusanense]|uniref:Uncharacterized protein n=1 Tax=Purpureocillium takamizusanense TaxID=2060973 RepID=A0A9Q8Q938_9HYPO|nr:uncharacterized protein JDV02_001399 [Purpureocillium takamizusanense]UNI14804.1 hypothetical protein JDV02_001399 [Purpureocillium takamizusanense]
MASQSPAADWGHLGGLSPAEQVEYRGGVLAFDGNPDFSESKVWAYVESFQDNILNMHPIIQPKVLNEWVRHFLDSLPRVQAKTSKPRASRTAFAVRTPVETTGSKRKRSPEPYRATIAGAVRAGKPDRSVHSALILTVLALGKVCLYRDNVPDALHHSEQVLHGSPFSRNGVPQSPIQDSLPNRATESQSSGPAKPKESERMPPGRRSSGHGQGQVLQGYDMKKNYEVILGLEYFALATDILGNYLGAYNSMGIVYTNIFAGLYYGQLARPLESFAFIHAAGHKLQAFLRPSFSKLRGLREKNELPKDTRSNQFALAFWTCLQLESDLIAELPLPHSGLLSYENDMPPPNLSLMLLHGFNQEVLESYSAQLALRTHLNTIHRTFYAPDSGIDSRSFRLGNWLETASTLSDVVSSLERVTSHFAIKPGDPPAGDILSARLRGKYWGAQAITYRPFIRMVLERKQFLAAVEPSLYQRVIEHAQRGIEALIESTRAFHGLGNLRPIVTNVFGTAHA